MSVISNNQLAGAAGQGGADAGFKIDRSLRFNSGDSAYLSREFSAGNRRTWTWSGWIKRTDFGTRRYIFTNYTANGTDCLYFEFDASNRIHVGDYATTAYNFSVKTTAVYRDPSAWYHVVVGFDTTQGTASARVKIYVNGSQVTTFDTANYPSQNYQGYVNQAANHTISYLQTFYGDFYLADVHFIDGQALAPTDFGEYDSNNVWQPKEYSGSYGTNGFQLDFSDTTSNQALGYDASVNSPAVNNKGGFDAITYTGTGSTRTIKGLAFQPDLVWVKRRNSNSDHQLYDSVRGALKGLYSNQNSGDWEYSTGLSSFNSDGFSVGSLAGLNGSGDTHIAWCWKAGGPASSNTDGSITSQVSASDEYGFSVVSYTGATNAQTVGHGLSSAPKFIIAKNRDTSSDWVVYHESLDSSNPEDKFLRLNQTNTTTTSADYWGSGGVTNSVFGVDNGILINSNGQDVIAYCWKEVSGFSKFGSYTGNGSSAGPTVTTGFKPRYILIKANIAGEDWVILDTARDTGNPVDQIFFANTNVAELTNSAYDVEIKADGFQIKNTNPRFNSNGSTYYYAAFGDRDGNNWKSKNLIASTSGAPSKTLTRFRTKTDWNYHRIAAVKVNGSILTTGTLDNTGSVWSNPDEWKDGNANSSNVTSSTSARGDWFDVTLASSVSNFSDLEIFMQLDSSSGTTTNIYEIQLFFSDGTSYLKTYAANSDAPNQANAGFNSYQWQDFGNLAVNSAESVDSLIDTPTNYEAESGNNGGNYATWNPLQKNSGVTLSNGNLKLQTGSNAWKTTQTTIGMKTGKFYWEFGPYLWRDSNNHCQPGVAGMGIGNSNEMGGTNYSAFYHYSGTKFFNGQGGAGSSFGASWNDSESHIIGVAFDADTRKVWFSKNGVWQGSGNPSAGTNEAGIINFYGDGTYAPTLGSHGGALNGGGADVNFGQRAFKYAVPTGFSSLCTTNLPDPTIADGSTAFDVALFTGNGSSQTISGLGFSPDLVWTKLRSIGFGHRIWDTVRGATKRLEPHATTAEATEATALTAFTSDGFSVGAESNVNLNSGSLVAWAWDAGDNTVSNSNGSITSTVRANPSAGFSIVSYTGTGSNATIGHGLNAAPKLVIIKNRDSAYNWVVGHADSGFNNILVLNEGYKAGDTSQTGGQTQYFNDTAPTSSVFTVGTAAGTNKSGDDNVALLFSPVAGYSAFGSYTGNGSADGPFIYTGMRPALVLWKRTDAVDNWAIVDNSRSPFNVADDWLGPNSSSSESSNNAAYALDFCSNGFKVRATHSATNASGGTYIYIAFAENPFKTARAH